MEDVLDLRRIAECDAPGRVDESLTLLLGEVCQPIAAPVPPERKVASTNVEDDEQIGVHCRSGGYAQGRPQLGISEPRGLGDDFDRQYGRLGVGTYGPTASRGRVDHALLRSGLIQSPCGPIS